MKPFIGKNNNNGAKIIISILGVYAVCFLFRCLEYFLIRTDQTFFGEAFIHKLLGIGVMFLCFFIWRIKPKEAGFALNHIGKKLGFGAVLGISVFILAYGIELIILAATGKSPYLQFYVSGFSVDGNIGNQTGFWFFILCIVGNVINVVMEEGVFRGLFLKLAEKKFRFVFAVIISSVLFGLWHIVAPIRSYIDGERSLGGTIAMMIMMIFATGATGAKFCLMTKITGSLYCSMIDHFINNTVVNILHVATDSGVDELQTVRIAIAQTISFLIVLAIFLKGKFYKKSTFRMGIDTPIESEQEIEVK